MGKIIPIGDSAALAEAVFDILNRPQDFRRDPDAITQTYLPDTIAAEYEKLFEEMQKEL